MTAARLLRILWAVLSVFGAGYIRNWFQSRKIWKLEKAKDYMETRKDVDDADAEFDASVGNDPDAARRWLRERKP